MLADGAVPSLNSSCANRDSSCSNDADDDDNSGGVVDAGVSVIGLVCMLKFYRIAIQRRKITLFV